MYGGAGARARVQINDVTAVRQTIGIVFDNNNKINTVVTYT